MGGRKVEDSAGQVRGEVKTKGRERTGGDIIRLRYWYAWNALIESKWDRGD